MRTLRSFAIPIALLSVSAVAAGASPAYAGFGGDVTTSGDRHGRTVSAKAAKISYDLSKNGSGDGSGPVTVADGSNWSPPPCWYAPLWSPKEFKKSIEDGYASVTEDPDQPNYAKRSMAELKHRYKDGKYRKYNLDKQGDGMWWGAVENPNEPDALKRMSCNDKLPFWVKNGVEPNVDKAIDPEILAGLAYQQIVVPGTDVHLSPDGKQTVNLDTWAWLDDAKFKPVSVTASVEDLGISATTTATPVALKIDAGTEDADLHPSSGVCRFNKDGSIGTPYTRGHSDDTPPCGLTYLRASGSRPYQLSATVTWKVEWTGTGGAGGDLPDGTFAATQDVAVQEIQSVNR